MTKPLIGALLVAAAVAATSPARADGDASNLDSLVAQVYDQVQRGCTPRTPPQFQRIIWDGTGPTGGGGTGRIVDANPGLGGPFSAWWNLGPDAPAGARSVPSLGGHGYWDITLEFC